jgi:hypothetical protein
MYDLPQAHIAGFASFISACQPLFPSDTGVVTTWRTQYAAQQDMGLETLTQQILINIQRALVAVPASCIGQQGIHLSHSAKWST